MVQDRKYREIDIMRCVLIIMVVMIHIVHFNDRYPCIKPIIYDCSMPGFVFLTGYLTNLGKDYRAFATGWVRWLILYVIMEGAYAVASHWLPVRDGLTTLSVNAVLDKICLDPIGPYWFLHTMLWGQLVAYLSMRAARQCPHPMAFIIMLCAGYLLSGVMEGQPSIIILFLVGAILRQAGIGLVENLKPGPWAVLPIILYFVLYNRGAADLLAQCIMIYSTFSLILWLSARMHWGRLACHIGRNTLPIFIFHPIFTALSKAYQPWFDGDSTALSFTIVTIVLSVAGSLGIAVVLDKTRLSILLGRPRLLRD